MRIATTVNPAPRYFQFSWVAACLAGGGALILLLTGFFSFVLPEAQCASLLATFTVFCLVLAYQLVQQRSQLIWSPMPWFLVATAVYLGFGPLLYFLGSDDAKQSCQDLWPVNLDDLYRVTLLNIVGVVLVFAVWWWRTRRMILVKSQPFASDSMVSAIVLFYAIGIPARLIMILSEFSTVINTVPGFLSWVADFSGAGLVLLTFTTFRRGGMWWVFFGAMLLMDLVAAMGMFSKTPFILAVIPCIFGYLLYRPGVRSLRWAGVVLLVVYLASNSYVNYCRPQRLGNEAIVSRVETAKSYFQDTEKQADESQGWWSRLNYAHLQAFAMQDYDGGNPGDSFALAWIAPIPRFLWPGKPLIESGRGFYKRLTGGDTATFGMGFFAEAYWNGGWWYVIFSSLAIGWIFGTVTLLIAKEQSAGNLWILPIALLWVRSGGRVDGWMHTEIVGPAAFTLLYIGLLRILRQKTSASQKNHHPLRPKGNRIKGKLPPSSDCGVAGS